ncbi:MAG: FAD-linked oxidase C-terminal domain-containing protein, partial [Bacteroidota bacterium]
PLPFIEDAGIPTEVLPEYIDRALQVCAKHQTEVAMYAHASVGVIHLRPILDLRLQEDIDRFKAIAADTFALVKEYGGSWSGEHGDGLVRSPFNEAYFGETLYGVFKAIKGLFDPENRMNPGKIVDSPSMDQNLRYGSTYEDQNIETVYHYRADEGFAASVHMCTGVGECRKILGGTMCPSFKVTRDEEQSTRGRANAMRLAMSGSFENEGLDSPRLQEALDLCLSCKACKSECPSNVDMAKLKGEVRQLYYDTHGTTARDRAIRDTPIAAKRFSGTMAKLVNWTQASGIFRRTLEKNLGFDRRRQLPSYASQSFVAWYKQQRELPNSETGLDVVLYADTYLNYFEPSVGKAAYQLLKTCGYRVHIADVGCCQRPAISHGFLRQAKARSKPMLEKLDAFLQKGWPILVCEPSCASALTDDLPDLIDDEGQSRRLKAGVFMIDQFLAKELEHGRISASLFRSSHTQVTLHGHCHQKALFGTQGMKKMYKSIPGVVVNEIDSGCCGMAGSFGYEKEHYHLSEKMGERALFPAVRNCATDTAIVACGFSCRHQIEHFTGRRALHWVETLEGR